MSDEYESLNSRVPDFASALAQRVAEKSGNSPASSPTGFDPHKLMVDKKQGETAPIDPPQVQKWPERDVKTLEDYCQRMGIAAFNSGRMPPLVALAMLKKQIGDYYTDVPLEERLPSGYQKIGSNSNSPNYPYTAALQKKRILHG